MERLSDSYLQAVKAVKHCKGIVSHFNDLPIAPAYEYGYPIEREKHLEEMIQKGDAAAASADAESFFQWMTDTLPEHDMAIRLKVLEFVMRAEFRAFHEGGMKYSFLDRDEYLQAVLAAENYEELRAWFVRKIAESARNVNHQGGRKSQPHHRQSARLYRPQLLPRAHAGGSLAGGARQPLLLQQAL